MVEGNVDLKKWGKRLSQVRQSRDMTLFDLAAEAEMDIGMLEKLERGEAAPLMIHVMSLARSLMVSPEYLLGLSETPAPSVSGTSRDLPDGTVDALESVLNNETGWHARGFLAPTEVEKQFLRDGLSFMSARPRELVQFYWDIVPFILGYIRIHPSLFSNDLDSHAST